MFLTSSGDDEPIEMPSVDTSDDSLTEAEEAMAPESALGDVVFDDAKSPDDAPPDVGSVVSSSGSVENYLTPLLQIAAGTGRGEFATKTQKEKAESLIAALEEQNPTMEPANSPLVNGQWELLYSSTQLFRSSPFFMAGRAVCSTPDQAKQYDWFCEMHRKALAISSIGQVRQIISPTRLVSEFEVVVGAVPFLSDFTPFTYSGGVPVRLI